MNHPTLKEIEVIARTAGEILRDGYEKEHDVQFKGVIDLVTEIDHQSEKYLLGEIGRRWPESRFVAEESGESGGGELTWYIDPLDGTVNYAHHVPIFCVSIAYAYCGTLTLGAEYDPLLDDLYIAERGKGAYLNEKRLSASNVVELQSSLLVTGFP